MSKKKKMITVNVSRCVGCHSCQLACAVAHSVSKTLVGAISEHPRQKPRVHVESVEGHSIPLQCQHCEDAPCVAVCPSGALHRYGEGKPVLMDSSRCIGCKMCIQACPFGVITMREDGKSVLKCDLCVERLAQGQQPACVEACPTRALRFEEIDEASGDKRRKAAKQILAAEQK